MRTVNNDEGSAGQDGGEKRLAIAVLASSVLAACGPSEIWKPGECVISHSVRFEYSDGGSRNAPWSSCAAARNVRQPFILALMAPDEEGALCCPGRRWLNLFFTGLSAPEDLTAQTDTVSIDDDEPPSGFVNVKYGGEGETLGYASPASGTVAVKNFGFGDETASMELEFKNLKISGARSLTVNGTLKATAIRVAPASSGGGGGGGGGGGNSSCDRLAAMCTADGAVPVQRACYCAAACLCAASGDRSCEQQNRSSASALGGSCSY